MKYLILQGDGMPDHPVPALGGKTPLEVASTPALDFVARHGLFGLAVTIPEGMSPGSDVGNLSVLGYDPAVYYTGRSPLEAASIGIELGPEDVSYRCNLVTLVEVGGRAVMEDYSAGHIESEDARELIEAVGRELADEGVSFHAGVSYRHLMVWPGGTEEAVTTPPHDISGRPVEQYLPRGEGSALLRRIMERSRAVLADHPVNRRRVREGKRPATSIWLWGAGRPPALPSFRDLWGIEGAVVSAVDLVKGIGVYADMEIVEVPGATGYLDTDYEGKVRGALEALERCDLVMVHIEATDETGHEGEPALKVRAVEDFDNRVVAPLMRGAEERFGRYRCLVVSDHPTPLDVRTHVREPVPFAIYDSSRRDVVNDGLLYTEKDAARTGVVVSEGWTLLGRLLGVGPGGKGDVPATR